jgi:S-methylmethionine-dependent homocysteine/selenocysteine methylase
VNRAAVELLGKLRGEYATADGPVVLSGCIGPRDDGYQPETLMTASQAEAYHTEQVAAFQVTDADLVTAITMTHTGEAIGIARAAQAHGLPSVIPFTVETDGRLPSGETLEEAIKTVDEETASAPAYYMVNCAHPTHVDTTLIAGESWNARVRGLRANASTMSHAELDVAEEGRRRHRRSRRALRRAPREAAAADRAGRLLRHRRQAHRRHSSALHRLTPGRGRRRGDHDRSADQGDDVVEAECGALRQGGLSGLLTEPGGEGRDAGS